MIAAERYVYYQGTNDQGSETGSQIRKRRQMEIDITQPQIIPQPEKPKLTNRKGSKS